MPDLRLALTEAGARLPWRAAAAQGVELPPARVVAAARAAQIPGTLLLCGGEPLGRRDLAGLLAELAQLRPDDLGLCTAGEGLTSAAARQLASLGVRRVHIPFHCARQDAHDWLFGRSGALKTAHRAILSSVEANLAVVAEVVLTRPTAPHLAETVGVLSRLGVRVVQVRRLREQDAPGAEFVPLSPRLGLLAESLESAAAVALERRMRLRLRDFPLCTAPRLRPLFAAPGSEIWLDADGAVRGEEGGVGCADCPGSPRCAGAPLDYVARFGWEELVRREERIARVAETVADQQRRDTAAPMVFAWRGPHRVRCEDCGDGPAPARGGEPFEPTRGIRARLVEAARFRPAVLRLVGGDLLAHPDAAALIFDALRLFPRVEVAGEASAAVDWTDLELRRMKEIGRFDVAFYGPDAVAHDAHCGIPGAFAATLRAATRLRDAGIPVGAYAVLHDERAVAAFAEAWNAGRLPGVPRFRLSPRGSDLKRLAQAARTLPSDAARRALVAVLPRCLGAGEGLGAVAAGGEPANAAGQLAFFGGRTISYRPCGSDPIGAFETCQEEGGACARAGCPGWATGWREPERSQRWSGSN